MIHPFAGWRPTQQGVLTAVIVVGCCALVLAWELPAGAIDVTGGPR